MDHFPFTDPLAQAQVLGIRGDVDHYLDLVKRHGSLEARLGDGECLVAVSRDDLECALSDYPAALMRMSAYKKGDLFELHQIESYLPTRDGFCRLRRETREAYAAILADQPSAAILLRVTVGGPDQEGLAPAEARERMFARNRFPLDPVVIASMIRAHRLEDRLIWLDALGAEISPKGDGRFDDTPYFDCRRGHIIADWNWATRARSFRLAVSAASP